MSGMSVVTNAFSATAMVKTSSNEVLITAGLASSLARFSCMCCDNWSHSRNMLPATSAPLDSMGTKVSHTTSCWNSLAKVTSLKLASAKRCFFQSHSASPCKRVPDTEQETTTPEILPRPRIPVKGVFRNWVWVVLFYRHEVTRGSRENLLEKEISLPAIHPLWRPL